MTEGKGMSARAISNAAGTPAKVDARLRSRELSRFRVGLLVNRNEGSLEGISRGIEDPSNRRSGELQGRIYDLSPSDNG